MIRAVINCQPPRPKYSNPDLGSIVADITNTVLSLFFASSIRPSNSGARGGRQGSPALDVLRVDG